MIIATALAAKLTNRPVRCHLTRFYVLLSPMHCRKSEMTATEEFTVQLFLDSDCKAGTFRFRSTHSFHDATALAFQSIISTTKMIIIS